MKGIVFTEFTEMVEKQFGYEMLDELLVEINLPSGGAYTAIGTYSQQEIITLVHGVSRKTGIPLPMLLRNLGQHLFHTFSKSFKSLVEVIPDAFTFLEGIETNMHAEVRKIYPDAELPYFQTKRLGEDILEMIYQSEFNMSDLAEGIMVGCLDYFNEKANIQKEALVESGKQVRFLVTR